MRILQVSINSAFKLSIYIFRLKLAVKIVVLNWEIYFLDFHTISHITFREKLLIYFRDQCLLEPKYAQNIVVLIIYGLNLDHLTGNLILWKVCQRSNKIQTYNKKLITV